jgi:two-component system NtrC family sensor kinase
MSLIDLRLQAWNFNSVRGNAAELEQVILNLILNALDAVAENGIISIRTRQTRQPWGAAGSRGQWLRHRRRNTCPSCSSRFSPPSRSARESALDLSTCYHIIEAHGGDISVDSAPEEGARFTVRLPAL